jgi:replicative DNA helicase
MIDEIYSAQEGVLGWIMLFSPDAAAHALSRGITEEWFTQPKALAVFRAIKQLLDEKLVPHTHLVAGKLAQASSDVECRDLARMLDSAYPTSLSFGSGLSFLAHQHAERTRSGLWASGREARNLGDADSEREVVDLIAESFVNENPPETLQSAAAAFAESLRDGTVADYGIPTGLLDIDRTLGTLQPGELIVVAARPGCGKSSLLRQIAVDTAMDGRGVRMVSTEMGPQEIIRAATKQLTGVPWAKDRQLTAEQLTSFRSGVIKLSTQSNLRLVEDRNLTTLMAKWRSSMVEEYPPHLFVVDYLQQLDAGMRKGETLAAAVGRISGELKSFAREFKVVVMAAAQLNRESAKDGDPQLHHLRDSGSIEQDADRVIMLKLAENDNPELRLATVEVFQRKHRNGPIGSCRLMFDRWTTRFSNHAH